MESDIKQRLKRNQSIEEKQLVCSFPKSMLLELTNACNDSCLFCANSKSTRKHGIIDNRLAKRILSEAYDLGTREVGFYATGEPLLDKNLEEYILYAKSIGYEYVYITTNGALLTEERAETIIDAGIDSVKFSINASDARTYYLIHGNNDFDQVINNLINFDALRKKQKKKVALYISYIVTRYTEGSKEKFVRTYGKYADDIVFMNCHNLAGCMTNEIKKYLSVDENTRYIPPGSVCPMIFKNFYVSYEGYLTLCCTDFQNYLAIADLNKERLKDAWNNDYAQGLRRRHLEHNLKSVLCSNCINDCNESIEPLRPDLAVCYDSDFWSKEDAVKIRINSYQCSSGLEV